MVASLLIATTTAPGGASTFSVTSVASVAVGLLDICTYGADDTGLPVDVSDLDFSVMPSL